MSPTKKNSKAAGKAFAPAKDVTASSPTKKPPTKSAAFSKGEITKSPPNMSNTKDNRHEVYVKGLQNGIVVAWLKKYNKNEEPYLRPDYKLFEENPNLMEPLGINAIIERKGADGKTPMLQGAANRLGYTWKQFMYIVGDESNTAENRKKLANKLINYLNKNMANEDMYQYTNKCKFAEDKTGDTLMPVSEALLDIDVVAVMASAYSDTPLNELAKFEEIMMTFWTDVAYGCSVIME